MRAYLYDTPAVVKGIVANDEGNDGGMQPPS